MPEPEIPPVENQTPPVVQTPPPERVDIPKTKEDWQKLAQDNPQKWIELTQSNMDRVVRESRELKEKLEREQQEKNNLSVELNRYKQPIVPEVSTDQKYGVNNFPKTPQEWDTLFIENPTYATDLRHAFNTRQTSVQIDFNRARQTAAKEVQVEHPELYVCELDASGQPLKDGNGKPVIKKDGQGLPLFNPNSEKGKLWDQIYKESARPDGTNPLNELPNAPTLMMAELERRLVKKGQTMIQNQTPELKQNQVAQQGVPPPIVSANVKFATDAEKQHAEKAVARGTFTSLEEYCKLRDNGDRGYWDENRKPDFAKK